MFKYRLFIKRYIFILPLSFLCGCGPMIDYSMESVPEEGGIHLTRFTNDDENTISTAVVHGNGTLTWSGNRYLAVTPDGNKLAFIRWVDGKDNIYIKNTAGGTSAVQRTFRTAVSDICFSPDSKFIAFSEMVNGFSHIYMMNASEGSAVQEITSANNYDDVNPAFSSDGTLIYFSRIEKHYNTVNNGTNTTCYSGVYTIWSYNLKTGLLTQYDEGFDPSPMPDGESILVGRTNKANGLGEIWMLNTRTGAVTQILPSGRMGFSNPAISPDGKRIVCVGASPASNTRPANLDIYTVNIDGTGLTQLTFHPADDMCPTWSSDGKSIYFISGRANKTQRYNVWQMVYTRLM